MSLDEIYKLYQQMLSDARQDRWDKVQQNELKSEQYISDFFNDFDAANASAEEEDLVRKIAEANSQLIELSSAVKQEFIQVVQDALKQNKAIRQYEKHKNIKFS